MAVVLVAVGVLAAVAFSAGAPRPGEAYDPRSVAPLGLAGLVELLRDVGVEVEVSTDLPSDVSTYVFVPVDRGSDQQRDDILRWVDDGGRLVVAGPSTMHDLELLPGSLSDAFGVTPREPGCDAPALQPVRRIAHGGWSAFAVDEETTLACFPVGDGASWLVVQERGRGSIVALASADPLVNANLAREDNAILAAALLGPASGAHLVVMPPPEVGSGGRRVTDVVPAGFWRFLALASAAVVVGVVWTARRLGRPVEERLPPVLPSAELTRSVAGLLQRAGDRGTAAARLRADTRRRVERVGGRTGGSTSEGLVAWVTANTEVDGATARRALQDDPVTDDRQLLEVAAACRRIRRALRAPGVAARPPAHGDHRVGGQDDTTTDG